ncbi:MAG: LCP family protein [Selenomonadaceae bacterium]|nr:LCP family protein [Selenomonadaceae bacterium]
MRERLEERRRALGRKMRNRKLFWSFIICTLIVVGSLAHLGFNSDFTRIKEDLTMKVAPEKILPTLQKTTTIMLMGVDERKDDVGRSDTLMVLQLSKDKASLLTIPRDTLVYMEKYGYQKINAAYAYGGAKLARKTVEEFLGIDIDRYVMINKARFAEVIDAMGGVDIYVERDMHYEDPWDDDGGLHINIKQGIRHLDGQTAIEFVRFRDAEGDVGRVRRQQAFMKACADRLSEPSMLIKIPELLSVAVKAVDTDLSSSEMLATAGSLKNAEAAGNIKTGVVPGWLQYIDGISYLIPNAERLGKVMTKNLDFEDVNKKHFDKLAYDYTPGNDADYYDVNPNPEKDLRLLDYLDRYNLDLPENKL